jgi:hypothetical protein
MRKWLIAVVGLVLSLVTIGVALAAPSAGPRLDGKFKMTATIQNNDIGIPPGTVTTETYVFKAPCGKGTCSKVGLTRDYGGKKLKSTLKRTAPGVYKGTEGPEPYVCVNPLGTPGKFKGEHKVKVLSVKLPDGRPSPNAKKITDKLVIHITGCKETIEEVSLTGKLTK